MATLGMLLVLLSTTGVAMASYCYHTTSYSSVYGTVRYKGESFYCNEGCCGGYSGYYYCCPAHYVDYYGYSEYVSNATGGIVAGIVIGSLVGVGLFVAFIVFICVYCVNANRRSMPGQVIGTQATGQQIAYVNTREYKVDHVFRQT
ncbi:uncharacterized protein LOC110461265 isoform X2 [Mizuhopecten yessoensis]|uniref:uncharacterized protein LOC110461265 isoform X2 n=1 Tax=Mizuhopecten yessoensis TaxID=6573 RepID=UPI000B458DC0|nr:uncharacterized protein LOC110461265 isoform X2 [Mizuhopecten yessoensis]